MLLSCANRHDRRIDELTAKKPKKLEKNSDTRMLDPWERYRALIDPTRRSST